MSRGAGWAEKVLFHGVREGGERMPQTGLLRKVKSVSSRTKNSVVNPVKRINSIFSINIRLLQLKPI
jgi:hypothetical protein